MIFCDDPTRVDIQRSSGSIWQKIPFQLIHIWIGFIFMIFYIASSLVHFFFIEDQQHYAHVESVFYTSGALTLLVLNITFIIQRNAIAKCAMQFEALVESSNRQKTFQSNLNASNSTQLNYFACPLLQQVRYRAISKFTWTRRNPAKNLKNGFAMQYM